MVFPTASSTGLAASKSAASPPTMIDGCLSGLNAGSCKPGSPARMRHRDGRPANRLRLVRRSRRRRHGVDDPGGPYLAPGARAGYRYGDSALVDPTAHDALFCSVDMRRTGGATDSYSKAKDIGRAERDEYAAMSHDRAATAAKNALLDDEIVAAEVPQRRGDPLQVSQDDGVRPATSAESLGKLRPAFARTAPSPPGRPAGPQNWPRAL